MSGSNPTNQVIYAIGIDSQSYPLLRDASGALIVTGSGSGGSSNVNLVSVSGTPFLLGQHTMAGSLSVAIASDQSAIPVTGTITTSPNVNVHDGAGNSISSTAGALSVNVSNFPATQPVSGTVTANQGTSPWITSISTALPAGSNVIGHVITDTGSTTAVTGNVTVVQPTGTNLHVVVDSAPTTAITLPADTSPATQNITVVDTGTTTTSGANNQAIYTGTPTAGSTASFSVSSQESVGIQVTGTWTGTLQIESSIDGGTTWSRNGGHQKGVTFNSASFTANFEMETNVSTTTNIRVRATAAITGTATVKIVLSVNSNAFFMLNPLQLLDGGTTGTKASIKAASTPTAATDTSLVVAQIPSTPSVQNGLTTTVKAIKSSAAGNLKGYYIFNPNSSVSYIQIFDVATAGAVTLGTTVAKLSLGIPALGAANLDSAPGIAFANGIQVAATTTATGSVAPSTAVDANFWFV